jgi:hypothetical protein
MARSRPAALRATPGALGLVPGAEEEVWSAPIVPAGTAGGAQRPGYAGHARGCRRREVLAADAVSADAPAAVAPMD